nr:hypothetical protein [Tanacetum cinerariifolium]
MTHTPSTTSLPAQQDHTTVLNPPQPQTQFVSTTTPTQAPLLTSAKPTSLPTNPQPISSLTSPIIPQSTTAQPDINLSNTHPMVTRAKDGISKSINRLTLRDPNWQRDMLEEYNALITNDDIILTTSSSAFLQRIIASLHSEFAMTDLGILERAHLQKRNPCRTPADTESKLGDDGDPVSFLYMHDPREPHNAALSAYFAMSVGLLIMVFSFMFSSTNQLTAYTNTDWAGFPVTRRSTSGYCVFLVAETAWVRNLLRELHAPLFTATLVYCDNVRMLHDPSRFQYVGIFTKGLPSALFLELRSSLNIRMPPVSTVRMY